MTRVSDKPVLVETFVPLAIEATAAALAELAHAGVLATMDVDLGRDLQMPINACIAVTAKIALRTIAQRRYALTIKAQSRPGDYPQFRGELTLQETRNGCTLKLQGRYSVPRGWFGEFVDSTFARNAAQESLHRFLDHLAGEIHLLAIIPARSPQ